MKNLLRWSLLCGAIGLTPVTRAQEPTQPEVKRDKGDAAKPSKEDDAGSGQGKGEKPNRGDIARAQREMQAAQKAVAKAQAEAKRAQAEVLRAQGQAQRAQADAERAQVEARQAQQSAAGGRLQRADGSFFGVVRDGNSRQLRMFRSPGGFVEAFGLDFVSADPILRAQLGLSTSEGLVITNVVAGGPAEKAGVQKNDVIAKLDGKSVHVVPEAQAMIADRGKPAVVVNLIRAGKPVELTWTKPEAPASKEPFYIGVYLAPVDATLRSQLPSLPEGAGMVVTEVTPESPAAKADVKKYDIAIKIDERSIKENSDLSEQVQKTGGEPIKLTLVRGGEAKVLSMTPVRRPASQASKYEVVINSEDVFKNLNRAWNESKPGPGVPYPPLGAMPLPLDAQNLTRDVQDRLEMQIKELNKQMENLQKSIERMNKDLTDSKSDDKEKKKD